MRTQFKATSIFNMLHFGTKKTHCLHMKIGLSPQARSKGDSTVEDGHPDQARHKDLPSSYKNLDRCRVGVLDSQSKCQNCGVKDEQGCYDVQVVPRLLVHSDDVDYLVGQSHCLKISGIFI